ncbi:FtsK/SpoIIIE domain-containing protein [Gordonia malaquae]|uniref:FtsK/SpoIIIE domain-containing protein n=1 Tax=Gordonia malaquae TaxID=410332 RepID=UPI00301AABB9
MGRNNKVIRRAKEIRRDNPEMNLRASRLAAATELAANSPAASTTLSAAGHAVARLSARLTGFTFPTDSTTLIVLDGINDAVLRTETEHALTARLCEEIDREDISVSTVYPAEFYSGQSPQGDTTPGAPSIRVITTPPNYGGGPSLLQELARDLNDHLTVLRRLDDVDDDSGPRIVIVSAPSPLIEAAVSRAPNLPHQVWTRISLRAPSIAEFADRILARTSSTRAISPDVRGHLLTLIRDNDFLHNAALCDQIADDLSGLGDAAEPVTIAEVRAAAEELAYNRWSTLVLPSIHPPLTRPIAFNEIDHTPESDQFALTIGVLDNPDDDTRTPYRLHPNDSHIRVIGDHATGVSSTIETIIAAAAQSYGADRAQFYVIDPAGSLSVMDQYPNVGRYIRANAPATDISLERVVGEFLRIADLRAEVMQARGLSSFSEYWASKEGEPVARDPYGHLFLVIDHAEQFFRDDEDLRWTQQIAMLADKGLPVGIHLVLGSTGEAKIYRLEPKFGQIVHHRLKDVALSPVSYPSYDTKGLIKAIPDREPGRIFDLATGLHGRILMPHTVACDPDPALSTDHTPAWSYNHDWRDATRSLGETLAADDPARAPMIETEYGNVDPEYVLHLHQQHLDDHLDQRYAVPLGISMEDHTLVTLPDPNQSTLPPHLIISGDRALAGKTTMVRWLLRWIMSTYQPGEALVYLFNSDMSLLDERDQLDHADMLGGYAAFGPEIETLATEVADLIRTRMPADATALSTHELATRSWWSGPEIFIVADPADQALSSMSGATMAELACSRIGLGVRMWVTLTSAELAELPRPFIRELVEAGSPTVLLPGTHAGTVLGTGGDLQPLRFRRRRPGIGQLYRRTDQHHPLLLIPNATVNTNASIS